MAWKPDYVTLAEMKTYLNITDLVDDTKLATCITAASRLIDDHTNRQFGLETSVVTRYYPTHYSDHGGWYVEIDDLMTTTGLVVVDYNGATIVGSDFDLYPRNAAADKKPWTKLMGNTGLGGSGYNSVKQEFVITAKFGWTTVPEQVKNAALLQASRLFMRKDAPFGITGTDDSQMRIFAQLDSDVQVLLSGLNRWWGAV